MSCSPSRLRMLSYPCMRRRRHAHQTKQNRPTTDKNACVCAPSLRQQPSSSADSQSRGACGGAARGAAAQLASRHHRVCAARCVWLDAVSSCRTSLAVPSARTSLKARPPSKPAPSLSTVPTAAGHHTARLMDTLPPPSHSHSHNPRPPPPMSAQQTPVPVSTPATERTDHGHNWGG
jgi:hypothetical protein